MAEAADQGDDVEAELVLRAGRTAPPARAGAGRRGAGSRGCGSGGPGAEADEAVEGGDGAAGLVGGPERPAAGGAAAGRGRQLQLAGRLGPGGPSGHRSTPRGVMTPSLNRWPIADQGSRAALVFF